MKINDIVEHKNKESESGYSHERVYKIIDFCRMKNPTAYEWVDGVIYRNIGTFELFVREKIDFENKFIIGTGTVKYANTDIADDNK